MLYVILNFPVLLQRKITVFPVIGIIWDINVFSPVPNAAEVESVFNAPLDMFLKVVPFSYLVLLPSFTLVESTLKYHVSVMFRMKIEEMRGRNGWAITICSISFITKLRMSPM